MHKFCFKMTRNGESAFGDRLEIQLSLVLKIFLRIEALFKCTF